MRQNGVLYYLVTVTVLLLSLGTRTPNHTILTNHSVYTTIGNFGRAWDVQRREKKRIQNFSGAPEGKRLLGKRKRRFADNIKPNLKEIGCCGVDSSGFP